MPTSPKTYFRLEQRPAPARLSIVIPVYNEESVVPLLRARLTPLLPELAPVTEVIIVNDGSTDHTLDALCAWADADERVIVLSLARNFGQQVAATAGIDAATGDAVVLMDGDLQDPPEIITQLLDKYRSGYDVVYTYRAHRADPPLKRAGAWLFYRLMRALVHPELPADSGDFRLMSRRCVDALTSLRETHRFLRGMVTWVGFPQVGVPFDRPRRPAGRTKYPLRRMIRFAWAAATSFSAIPLRVAAYLGALTALFGLAVGVYAVIAIILHSTGHLERFTPGWPSIICLTSILSGAILVSIGVQGDYIARIYEEAKGRPLYIVAEHYGARAAPGDQDR